jgi:hypothetical protein
MPRMFDNAFISEISTTREQKKNVKPLEVCFLVPKHGV